MSYSGADYVNHRANSEISMKFGMSVPDRLLFQKKVLATEKINMAAIFQDGRQMDLCFMILLKIHGANCDINVKFGRSVPSWSFIQMQALAMKKINMAAIF